MTKQMTVGEALRTPGTKLYAAKMAQREHDKRMAAMTEAERRVYYETLQRRPA